MFGKKGDKVDKLFALDGARHKIGGSEIYIFTRYSNNACIVGLALLLATV